MLKRTKIKLKKTYILKRKPLKKGPIANTFLNKTNSELKRTELNKQNERAKQKWEEVRKFILARDNNKCIICGKLATHVHHIHLRSKRKDLLYVKNNLISLCAHCHAHHGTEGLEEVNLKIAKRKHMTLAELLAFAETNCS